MIYGKLDPVTGRLTNIYEREPGAGDVPLDRQPSGDGPWTYDAQTRLAVPADASADDRLDAVPAPRRLLLLLAVRASSGWAGLPPLRRQKVQDAIDQYATAGLAALGVQVALT